VAEVVVLAEGGVLMRDRACAAGRGGCGAEPPGWRGYRRRTPPRASAASAAASATTTGGRWSAEEEEHEVEMETVQWAMEVGVWAVCLGVGLLAFHRCGPVGESRAGGGGGGMAAPGAHTPFLISSRDNESIRDAHDIWTRIKNKFDESKHDGSFCDSTSFGPCETNHLKEEEENERWRPNDESASPKGLSSNFDSHICCVANENDSGSTNEDEESWGLVLKCYELRTRQHKMLNVNALRPSKHYFP
jgi:hypothetical protein